MHLQVLPQNIPLLWQLINHKDILSIPELLRCLYYYYYGEFYLHAHTDFQTMKKVSSLLDDPRTFLNKRLFSVFFPY